MSRAGRLSTVVVLVALTACAAPAPAPSAETVPGTMGASSAAASTLPSEVTPAGWRPVADAPLARLEMATAAHQGQIWLVGGLDPTGGALDEVRIWNPSTETWSEGPSVPVPIHHAALVSDGERLILIGGYVGSAFNAPTDQTWVLGGAGATAWEAGPPLPGPRGAGAAAWDGERVVFAGGVSPSGVVADVFVLTAEAWAELGDLPRPREHVAAASDGAGRVWFLGGRVGNLVTNMADVALVEGDDVRSLGSLPTPRGGVAAFHVPGIGACLTGGEGPDGAFTQVECVDAEGGITTLPAMAHPRHGHGAAVVDAIAYVLLGGPTPGLSVQASIEALDVGG